MIDLFLFSLSATTAAYWTTLLLRWPAWAFYPVLGVWGLGLLVATSRGRAQGLAGARRDQGPLLLGLLCALAGGINFFTLLPNADDFSFFHRALVQLDHMGAAFFLGDTAHDLAGLPPLSPLHVLTSIEPAVALLAHAARLPALSVLQLGTGAVSLFVVPALYFTLLRHLRFGRAAALAGAVAVVGFLAVSGDSLRDWGNVTLVRAWQGKCILWMLLVPMAQLFTSRFVLLGKGRDLGRLHAVLLGGVGLSGTAVFLLPLTVGLQATSLLLAGSWRRRRMLRAAAAATSFAPVVFAVLVSRSSLLPRVGNFDVWIAGWPARPLASLAIVFPSVPGSALAAGLLILAALAVRRRALGVALAAYPALWSLLAVVPPLSTALMQVLLPASFWRLAYALPVPLGAGVLVARLWTPGGLAGWGTRRGALRLLALMGLAAVCLAVKTPALTPATLSAPHLLKFDPPMLRLSQYVARKAPAGAVVLAPEPVVTVLALLRPDLRFKVTRRTETLHLLTNAGQPGLARERLEALQWLVTCPRPGPSPGIAAAEAWVNTRVVVAPDCHEPGGADLASVLPAVEPGRRHWVTERVDGHLVLYERPARTGGDPGSYP